MTSLLKSRKFWIAVAGILALVVMLATKQIDASHFEAGFVAILVSLKIGIAIEDHGTNSNIPGVVTPDQLGIDTPEVKS